MVGEGTREGNCGKPTIVGHGMTILCLVLRRQDVTTQGIMHHVRLEVIAQRMLHDCILFE